MDSAHNNPETNNIGSGVSEEQIRAAVEKSGYPLQTTVTEILRQQFRVQQEWCYIDKDTRDLRSIDIWAAQYLYPLDRQPRVRPQIDLLIECKQSQLPYIFFPSRGASRITKFPLIAGLRGDTIKISTDDDLSTYSLDVINVLDLSTDPFQQEPPHCSTFSKCVRKGSDIELSGVDAYISLVMPVIKALRHFEIAEQPVPTAWYFDIHLGVAVGVLDAPMIAATTDSSGTSLSLLPWVRIVRHEYLEEAERWERNRLWAVEIVHKDFLSEYLDGHLLPFARRFSERALRHPTELATGEGFAAGMGANCWNNIEGRLRVRSTAARAARTRSFSKHLLRLWPWRTKKD